MQQMGLVNAARWQRKRTGKSALHAQIVAQLGRDKSPEAR